MGKYEQGWERDDRINEREDQFRREYYGGMSKGDRLWQEYKRRRDANTKRQHGNSQLRDVQVGHES